MRAHGYDEAAVAHVGALIRKEQLKKDPESQALENIAAIVFLEHYFDEFLEKHRDYDDDKLVDILGKTLVQNVAQGSCGGPRPALAAARAQPGRSGDRP